MFINFRSAKQGYTKSGCRLVLTLLLPLGVNIGDCSTAFANTDAVAVAINTASVHVFTAATKSEIKCDKAASINFSVQVKLEVPEGSKCVVTINEAFGSFEVQESSVWFCKDMRSQWLSCQRTDSLEPIEDTKIHDTVTSVAKSLPTNFEPPTHLEYSIPIAPFNQPDPAVATLLSGLLGFGSGHFYAGKNTRGTTHAVLQFGGIVSALASHIWWNNTIYNDVLLGDTASIRAKNKTFLATWYTGWGVYSISRVIDIATAPNSARRVTATKAVIADPRLATAHEIFNVLGYPKAEMENAFVQVYKRVDLEMSKGTSPSALVLAAKIGQERQLLCIPVECLDIGLKMKVKQQDQVFTHSL
jgi:hypothetical protein